MTKPYVLQIIGYKNAGKTTLLCKLLQQLKARGMRVGTIKHDGHDFDIDHAGTDTWQHRAAGADVVAITSATQTALIRNQPTSLETLLVQMEGLDVVLVEGFKQGGYPKLVLLRSAEDLPLLAQVTHPVAVILGPAAASAPLSLPASMPRYDRDEIGGLLKLLLDGMSNR
ncbi:molybdopterin-guanine dinucleotide biosynthesis protein MobB [Paenibacillus sp. 598K]|uniref:molybdopterin-guanine dinucleotide biosynthesis protein B n=1 Tax=Paenibacillus sp. 598K TaxID=1117987 RepID=UPI000FFA18A3|nr:molybdopterin-guanine dinucleotide biosynthesis protein B [Paenibacillus sp. 598K]GBF74984.1 molybdopterin-guanine dinucleotide biosynthesis protein MobB [Paenibacillus sp. 598K]